MKFRQYLEAKAKKFSIIMPYDSVKKAWETAYKEAALVRGDNTLITALGSLGLTIDGNKNGLFKTYSSKKEAVASIRKILSSNAKYASFKGVFERLIETLKQHKVLKDSDLAIVNESEEYMESSLKLLKHMKETMNVGKKKQRNKQ